MTRAKLIAAAVCLSASASAPWRWAAHDPRESPPCKAGYVGVEETSGAMRLACLDPERGGALPCRPPGLAAGRVLRVESDSTCALTTRRLPAAERLALGVRLDVNLATAEELEALPGVGPRMAARIAAGRPFRSIADLERVRGIGPKTRARLSTHLVVAPPELAASP